MDFLNDFAVDMRNRRYLGVAGDWHRDAEWARFSLSVLRDSGIKVVIHLGDFGLMGNVYDYIKEIDSYLSEFGITLLVVPGNHENYDYINNDAYFHIDESGIRWARLGTHISRIGLLPRGYVWRQSNRNFMALGGASSIDYADRTVGSDWWLEENITEEEANSIIVAGHTDVDVMFCHDVPMGVMTIAAAARNGARWWDAEALRYADQSKEQLDRVFRAVQPSLLFHGHWHLNYEELGKFSAADNLGYGDVFESRIIGLGRESDPGNLAVLDTTTLETVVLSSEIKIAYSKLDETPRMFKG